MTTEEKKLTELLKEHLDDEDLLMIEPSEKYEKPTFRTRHKNRRWRQLNLKIKICLGVLLLGAGITGGVMHSNSWSPNTKTSITAEEQQISAKSPLKSNAESASQISASDREELPEGTASPSVSVSPTPVPVTPTVTPQPTSAPESWSTILVNPWNPLPDGFSVELEDVENGHSVDARIARYLKKMLADARAQGLSPMICSSYRTMEKQQNLYSNKVKEYLSQGYSQKDAESEAGKWVAVPGTSEHQTGLAVDIVSSSYQLLDQKQEETPEQKWLMENSYKYGFILRYPNEKREITGIYYEPWHYRYVGHKTAKEIYEKGICYEEYLESY